MIRFGFYCLLLVLVASCASPKISDYQHNMPVFELEQFFDGKLVAYGVVKNRSGKAIRHFSADISAHWDDGVGHLYEQFLFSDGERQVREWRLAADGKGGYIATANDVIGEGRGQLSGNALNLNYVLEIDYRNGKLALDVDDWMWLVEPHVVINHSIMRKFGVKVGSIQLAIIKLE